MVRCTAPHGQHHGHLSAKLRPRKLESYCMAVGGLVSRCRVAARSPSTPPVAGRVPTTEG
eukprot:scaffold1761_cov357-Prasinococcus_capsulatus_cf.AAC.11